MVTAHRGDWRNAPENSLRAFQYACDIGVDLVELDLQKTKDGTLVIMHDDQIDRTSNGRGRPGQYTLNELKVFRLKDALGRVTANDIPTLKEVMLALKRRKVLVNLDKSFEFYQEAYEVLIETGTLKQALFKSDRTYTELQKRYPDLLSKIKYMPVVNLDHPEAKNIITEYLEKTRPYASELMFSKDTSALLNRQSVLRNSGTRIFINSLWASLNGGHDDDKAVEQENKKDSWDWLIEHGAVIIQTDRPKLLLEYLRKKNLHS